MLSERDLEVADTWIRKHVIDSGDYDFDDAVEEGRTVKYWFHRTECGAESCSLRAAVNPV